MTGWSRKLAGFVLALLYSLVVFFVFGEIATRSLGLLDRLSGFPRALYMPTDDEDMPYRLAPEVVIDEPSPAVHVNSLGLRGAEATVEPVPGLERILVIGDSVVFGQGVAEAETFPVQLEESLRARGREVEVLNGGVPGYNNAAEAVFLREYGLPLKPRTVVLGVSLNDFGETPVVSRVGILTSDRSRRLDPHRWLPTSEFLLLIEWVTTYGFSGHSFQRAAARLGQDKLVDQAEKFIAFKQRRFYSDPSGPGWERVRRSLREIRDLCAAENVGLWLVLFPDRYQKTEEDRLPQRQWLKLCGELDLRCVDLWPAFAAEGGDLFVDVQHPNVAGHAVAARIMAERLTGGEE